MTRLHEVRTIIDDRLRRVNTALPGEVQAYDATTREAEVKPLVKEKYADDRTLDLPVIPHVPVVMPASASAGLSLPIGVGDIVLLLFAQRSLDNWAQLGGTVEAGDIRMHSLSDAIAVAGLFDFTITHDDGDGLLLYNGLVKIRLDGGKVAIGTSAVELLDEVTKALDDIVTGLLTIPYTPTITQAASAAIKTIKGTI